MSSQRTDLQCLDRQLQVIDRACRRSKMQEVVELAFDINIFGDVIMDKPKIRQTDEVGNILHRASRKVVHADDIVAFRDEPFAKMASKKSGAAGNKSTWHGNKTMFSHYWCDAQELSDLLSFVQILE